MNELEPRGAPKPPPQPIRPRFEFLPAPSEAPANKRPRAVALSYRLWIAAAVSVLAATLVVLLDLDGVRSSLQTIAERDFPADAGAARDQAVSVALVVLVVGGFLIAAGMAAAGAALGSGRGGTRYVLLGLLVLGIVHAVLSLDGVPPIAAGLLVVGIVLALGGCTAMFLPGTYRWFSLQSR